MIELKIGDKFTLTYLTGVKFKLSEIRKRESGKAVANPIHYWKYIDDDGNETGKTFGNRIDDIRIALKRGDWVNID